MSEQMLEMVFFSSLFLSCSFGCERSKVELARLGDSWAGLGWAGLAWPGLAGPAWVDLGWLLYCFRNVLGDKKEG